MYLPEEQEKIIALELVDHFEKKNMLRFSKFSAELYDKYGEYTADDIMMTVRALIKGEKKILWNLKYWGHDENGYFESTLKGLTRDQVDQIESGLMDIEGYEDHDIYLD